MEIIDKPLNEIIKEQKIGESLRKNRRGNRGGKDNGDRPRNQQQQQGGRGGRRFNNNNRNNNSNRNNNNSNGGGNNNNNSNRGGLRGRLRLRLRARRTDRVDLSRFRSNDNGDGNRLSRRRFAIDLGDDRRGRSAKGGPRHRVMDIDRNERTRSSRRREALSRARFSRG